MRGMIVRNTTDLNLRAGPSTNHTILDRLPTGTRIDVLDEEGVWLHVIAREREGYVHRYYVEFPRAAKTVVDVGLKRTPGETSSIVIDLYGDTQVLLFEEEGGWYETIALGLEGYLPMDALAFPKVSRTTGHVNLRIGPSTDHHILRMLPPNTRVHVWHRAEEADTWYYVADTTMSGYLHSDFVAEGAPIVEEGATVARVDNSALRQADLEPPADQKIHLPPNAGGAERQVADIWNRLGGLFAQLSAQLNIDPAVAVAVWSVESGGRAFGPDGRMIIRFENHIFHSRWGKHHGHIFQQHFTFNADKRWTDHHWRPAADQPWRTFHGDQSAEWEVLEFAARLDDTAAKSSISMGGPQIMGFNYAGIGYTSVQEMFDAFAGSERGQIIGFFDFVRGRGSSSLRVAALQAKDFVAFARYYNGPGQAAHYGSLIQARHDTFHRLKV